MSEALARLVRDALVLGVDHEGLARLLPLDDLEFIALISGDLLGVAQRRLHLLALGDPGAAGPRDGRRAPGRHLEGAVALRVEPPCSKGGGPVDGRGAGRLLPLAYMWCELLSSLGLGRRHERHARVLLLLVFVAGPVRGTRFYPLTAAAAQ